MVTMFAANAEVLEMQPHFLKGDIFSERMVWWYSLGRMIESALLIS